MRRGNQSSLEQVLEDAGSFHKARGHPGNQTAHLPFPSWGHAGQGQDTVLLFLSLSSLICEAHKPTK